MSSSAQPPAGLAVKLPFATPEEFLAKYGQNLTRGGIFLRSKSTKPPGTAVTLDLRLADGQRILFASCVVHFVTSEAQGGVSGMGLRFVTVDPPTQAFLDSSVAKLPHAKSSTPPVPPNVGTPQFAAPTAAAPPTLAQTKSTASATPTAPAFEAPTEEPKREGPIIGIDLGTTNSCAGFVIGKKPTVLQSREGYNTVPSVLALNNRGKLVVGHAAKGQLLTNPKQTVYGGKRLVGRAYDSSVVQQLKDRFAYEITEGANSHAAVRLGDRVYSLEEIAALILREVKEVAQLQLAQPISRAVITVPAYYSEHQRQAVRDAGRLAGLYVERILNEPTAAALAYGYGKKLAQRVLVYDLGGGTFDASLLELNDTVYEVLSTGGDTFLGGIDFDNAVVSHLLKGFEAKNGRPFSGDRVAMQRISDAAERAKCALSERQETRVHVPFVTMVDNQPLDLDVNLTRAELIELTGHLVDRTLKVCEEVLAAKGLTAKDVDEIILVGGQSRFPLVHQKLFELFGKAAAKSVHPDEAVAIGAALFAHSLGEAQGVTLIDVLPMGIGIGLPGNRMKTIIERNTPLPVTRKHTIATVRDDQTELEITLMQGDSPSATQNEVLGTLRLTKLPKLPRGQVKIEVSFEVSAESLLKVRAKELTTGREVESVFNTKESNQSVRKRLEAAETTGERAQADAGVPSPEAIASKPMSGFKAFWRRLLGRA